MRATTALLTLAFVFTGATAAQAKDFYVDPLKGSKTGDGSAAKPWRTIEEVIADGKVETQSWASLPYKAGAKLVVKNAGAPIKAGDTIYLRSGYHGALSIISHYNAKTITIVAQAGQAPKLKSVLVRSSKNWVLRGLQVSPEFAPTWAVVKQMVSVESKSYTGPVELVTVDGCLVRTVADTSSWTAAEWVAKAGNGIGFGGTKITIKNNKLKNVDFGITGGGTHSLVDRNVVENFSGDGMRGLGDHTVFSYNTVMNCYDVDANHDDGFQSWSVGTDGKVGTGTVTGVVLRGNLIINYTDPNQKHRGALQGIGMFDGTFVSWVVENNVIIVDHYHGISLYGVKSSRVVNNTVIDPNSVKPGPPWIKITNHKNGTAPTGCTVRNNLATAFTSATTGVTEDHNVTVKMTALGTYFVNAAKNDLHLKVGCPALDKGSATLAPKIDRDGVPRPQGSAVDVGAYEWVKPGTKFDSGAPNSDAAATADSAAPGSDSAAPGSEAGPDDGAGTATDGTAPGTRADDGCDCQIPATPGAAGALPLLALLVLLMILLRR
jgi:hypothetical protein